MSIEWWHWKRAEQALATWVRSLIGDRPYTITFQPGHGSFVAFASRQIVVDPTMPDTLGGASLLPRRWRRQRVTTLASLQWRCARALARHEAAHVLFTQPSASERGGVHHWLTNALEDGRIERALGALAPWCGADLRELGLLVWQHYTLPHDRIERLLSACLLHRWDVARPRTTAARVTFATVDDTRVWEEQIRPLVEEAWQAIDTERVAALASAILSLLGVPAEASAAGLTNPLGAGPSGLRAAGDAPLAIAPDGGRSLPPADDDPGAEEYASAGDPPGVDYDGTAGHMLMLPYRAIERELAGEIRRLIKELAPPTPNVAPRPHMVAGRFSVRNHLRSQGATPMVHRRDHARDPQGLALALLIDRTGSMGNAALDGGRPQERFFSPEGRMYHARRAALLLDRACAAAGIPLCIGFAGNEVYPRHGPFEGRTLHLPQSVVWLRDWTTPPEAEGPRACIAGMYGDAGNAERVSESVQLAAERLRERREQTRLIVYVHDGEPTDETPAQVQHTLAAVRRQGIIVIGLFVGRQTELPRLQAIFGPEHTIGVADLAKLPERLGAILKRHTHR